MPSAVQTPAPTPSHAVKDATAVITAALNVIHDVAVDTVTDWCRVLLDPDGCALLRGQRTVNATLLSTKRPLERAHMSSEKSHGRTYIVVQMDGVCGTFHRNHVSMGRPCLAAVSWGAAGWYYCAGCLSSAVFRALCDGTAILIASLVMLMDERDRATMVERMDGEDWHP